MKKTLATVLAFLLLSAQAHAFWSGNGELINIFGSLDLSGPTAANVGSLEEYVISHPGEEGVDEALLRLGRIYSDKKDYQKSSAFYARILESFPDSKFRTEASYELGVINYRTGRLKEALFLAEPLASDREATFALRARAGRLVKEIEAASYGITPSASLPAIGVLLPLKGDYKSFGEEALQGVLLAAGVFGALPPDMEVVVKDAGTDPNSIDRAITELASDPRVVGVVGPLLSSTATEAARSGQRLHIPVITLSQKEGVTSAGDYVFRNFLTPEDQGRALADYSIKKGHKRFAALFPQTNYGVELVKYFEMAVKERGGSVVRQAAYAPGTADFSAEVKRVFGIKATEKMDGRRKVREFTPTVKVDALFLPDSFESAALIVPYLDYYNIKGVQLLGANGWNSPRLPELAGKAVEGAVFVDGFFAASNRPGTEDFTRRFTEAYGKEPGVLSAQAYDAARMLMIAARDQAMDRESVTARLRGLKDYRGATGSISFNARREAEKGLFFLTVEGGRIIEAAPVK
jgi:ABC-type branched-subunit amino acid transport system substrate-binding protein